MPHAVDKDQLMPLWETRSIKVTLTIEVDGHTLHFPASGDAKGCFYHGEKPNKAYELDRTMEQHIRGTVDSLTAKVSKEANGFIARAYPVHTEQSSEAS